MKNPNKMHQNHFDINEQNEILQHEIEHFFPSTGRWGKNCFKRSSELRIDNLPCHLRNNGWISELLEIILSNKGISIPGNIIEQYINNSARFNELRHSYELEIVKWQIIWMKNGGSGWLLPKGCDQFSMFNSPDVVEIFRMGIVKTLTAIGMDPEVIEEGIEKNADLFLDCLIKQGFRNKFEPVMYDYDLPPSPEESHLKNWMKAKRYEYYCNHKRSIDKYGIIHPDMLLTPVQVEHLYMVLKTQNLTREKLLEQWLSLSLSEISRKDKNQEETTR